MRYHSLGFDVEDFSNQPCDIRSLRVVRQVFKLLDRRVENLIDQRFGDLIDRGLLQQSNGGWHLHHEEAGIYWWRTPHGHWLRVDPTGTHHHGRDTDLDARWLSVNYPAA